ncbi:MAG: tRNA dihydrouridine synthase DusB [Bacteroidetes bacterium]|nr:tRNA dihydrouridine synthase DusB [Bacteroidota bacterium]
MGSLFLIGAADHYFCKMLKIGEKIQIENAVVLAPMEDVTDQPFRRICRENGADIVYTEFVPSEAIIRDAGKSAKKMQFSEEERPVSIQIYGNQVEVMVEAAKRAEALGPDFLDINYGCPAKKIAGRGAGSGLLCYPDLMETITRQIVDSLKIPVTAKTRIGWDAASISIVETTRRLEQQGIKALTIHGRTKAQMFEGQADWDWIGKAKASAGIPIIGNGDITTPEFAREVFLKTGVDGLMIGRGAYGNPWIFSRTKHYLNTGILLPEPELEEKVTVMLRHLRYAIEFKGQHGLVSFRKHYPNYLKGFPNAAKLRASIVILNTYDSIAQTVTDFLGIKSVA